MPYWFQCTVKYEKTAEDGGLKKVSEPYLVSADNFSQVEKRIINELAPYISGAYEVSDIRRARFAEVYESTKDEDDKFYKLKLSFISIDDTGTKEKRISQQILVQADTLKNAIKYLEEQMKGTVLDYDILSVTETAIIDIYHYQVIA